MTTRMRVLLVDDHQMIRSGLRALMESQPDMTVVGEAADGRTAVRMAGELSPDVVVMDLSMPELNGIEATRLVIGKDRAGGSGGRLGGPAVVCLTARTDARTIGEALAAGASGYIPKDAAFEELADAVRTTAAGKRYISPALSHLVANEFAAGAAGRANPGDSNPAPPPRLSGREREVLQLLAEGKATKEVAAALKLSVKTIETHRTNLMAKLNLFSVAELTKYAIREGVTELN